MKNADEPINPVPYQNQDGAIQHDVYFGLTKREYFAAKAMQGLLCIYDNNEQNPTVPDEANVKYMARLSVLAADTLLAELSKPSEQ